MKFWWGVRVVDASAVVELLLRTPSGLKVEEALSGSALAAPAHLDAEVFSALGRLARGGEIDETLIPPALEALARAPIRRFAVAPLLAEAWTLRANVSQRDALYVVLARRLGAQLVTADGRLARAPGLGVAATVVL